MLASGVCDAFMLVFFEQMRPEAYRSQPWMDRQLRKVRGGIAEIARVVGNQTYVVRDTFGVADISAGSVLGHLEVGFAELGRHATHPNLARYMDGLMAQPSFQTTVPYSQSIPARWFRFVVPE